MVTTAALLTQIRQVRFLLPEPKFMDRWYTGYYPTLSTLGNGFESRTVRQHNASLAQW